MQQWRACESPWSGPTAHTPASRSKMPSDTLNSTCRLKLCTLLQHRTKDWKEINWGSHPESTYLSFKSLNLKREYFPLKLLKRSSTKIHYFQHRKSVMNNEVSWEWRVKTKSSLSLFACLQCHCRVIKMTKVSALEGTCHPLKVPRISRSLSFPKVLCIWHFWFSVLWERSQGLTWPDSSSEKVINLFPHLSRSLSLTWSMQVQDARAAWDCGTQHQEKWVGRPKSIGKLQLLPQSRPYPRGSSSKWMM
jgi:hypothetical protein